ncbi:MAG: GNAT family protein [Phaeodactylibacter sp.]|uniref:GNAT family N-acetyltransferase n=1 Tax=Phaeodactylibacter sp. TaxID=1940289 RepID=UPI0032EE4606
MLPELLPVNPQLELVRPELSHATPLFHLIDQSRAALEPWMGWVKQIHTPKEVHRFLFDAIRFNEGQQRCTFLVRSDQQLAGLVSLVRIEWAHHRAELGYWLGSSFQGKGIATHSCARLLAYAFEELCLNRIALRTAENNKRSLELARRLNFTSEGHLREALHKEGAYQHLQLFSLLRNEWKKDFF